MPIIDEPENIRGGVPPNYDLASLDGVSMILFDFPSPSRALISTEYYFMGDYLDDADNR
jgi:hypothetical protein